MSDLLLSWVNHELQLSVHVTDVVVDFASGFLLGEILFKLNQQHDFAGFMNSSIADAKIVNFCLLEPTMRNLRIKFDAKIAVDIMNEAPSAAANVLYQIKMVAQRLGRSLSVSTKSLERSGVQPLPNMPVKLPKPIYDADNHYFFEHSIRRHVESVAALAREKDVIVQEQKKRRAYLQQQADERELLAITKAERLHQAFIHSNFIKVALEESESPAWQIAIQRKHERENRMASFYQQVLAKRLLKQDDNTFSLRRVVRDDLDEFERRNPSKINAGGTRVPSRKSTGYGLRALSTTFERAHSSATNESNLLASSRHRTEQLDGNLDQAVDIRAIKEQKQSRAKRKEQLDRRRKRFVQGCVNYHSNMLAARVTSSLETLVVRETNCERATHRELEDVLVYKEIARENRELREEEYVKQRTIDVEAAIDRDRSSYERLRQRFEDDLLAQSLHEADLRVAMQAADHHTSQLIASSIMHDVVDFVLFIAGVRESVVHVRDPFVFLPEETWTEYKVQFASGRDLNGPGVVEDASVSELLSPFQLDQYLASFLVFHIAREYQSSNSEAEGGDAGLWSTRSTRFLGAMEMLEDRFVLGEVVKYVRWIDQTVFRLEPAKEDLEAKSDEASTEAVEILTEPAQETEEPAQVENPNEANDQEGAVAVQVEQPATPEQEPEQAPEQELEQEPKQLPEQTTHEIRLRILVFGPPFAGKQTQCKRLAEMYNLALFPAQELIYDAVQQQTDLGRRIQDQLHSGDEITSELYSLLVVDAVKSMEAASAPPKDGWIVYDLPGTDVQGQSLEEHLTGFIDPSLVPTLYDYASPIAPGYLKPAFPSSFLHGKSGVDLVFYLHCSSGKVLDRCLGQLEDSATQDRFHLIGDPPEEDSTCRHRLHHVNDSVNASELLSLQCLSQDAFSLHQKPWFERFNTLTEIETTTTAADDTHLEMAARVDRFLQGKEQEKALQQQANEAGEEAQMLAEEARQSRIAEFEAAIVQAQEELTRCQHAVQQAEEAKAKKEEIAELRHAVDAASHRIESATTAANDWTRQEHSDAAARQCQFSGKLLPPLSNALASTWNDMESEYTQTMTTSFDLQREYRTSVSDRIKTVVDEFTGFVQRPDDKQSVVDAFQEQFNQIVDEMRFDELTKQELHAQTDVLQDKLILLIQTRTQENEEELHSVLDDGWLEDSAQLIAAIHQMALQGECDRFRTSVQLLVDAFSAASTDLSSLSGLQAQLKATPLLLDLTCRLFHDAATAEELAPPVAVTPAPPAGKAAAKGKGKAAAAAAAPAVTAAPVMPPQETGDPTTVEALLGSYDTVLQKIEALVQFIIQNVAVTDGNASASNAGSASSSSLPTVQVHGDLCAANLIKGLKYEQELMQRRIGYLRESTERACDQLARSMRSVETTLRSVSAERIVREKAAIVALIRMIRSTIEAETNLPLFIDVKPASVYRFPLTIQLREDTLVQIDQSRRLVPHTIPDPPPVVEPTHATLLNARQCEYVRWALSSLGPDAANSLLPLHQAVEALRGLTTRPHVLPKAWHDCPDHVLAKIAVRCTEPESGCVSIDALIQCMSQSEAFLSAALAKEAEEAHAAAATTTETELVPPPQDLDQEDS